MQQGVLTDREIPSGEEATLGGLTDNTTTPYENLGHINGTITTPSAVIYVDLVMQVAPKEPGPPCSATGTAFAVPLG